MSVLSAYEKARVYFERHAADPSGKYRKGPCITISRETGAGANFVCDELMKYFESRYPQGECPWAVFDKNLIDKVIEDHNLPEKLKGYLNEEKYSTLNTVMNEMLGLHPPMVKLVHKTAETIMHLAQMGFCVIVGRGSNIITWRLPNALHVRLIAPYEHRLKHMKEAYNMTAKEAEEFIKLEDGKRKKYVETHFHKNPDDPHLYHLILSTEKFTFAEAAKCIGSYVLNV